MQKQNHYYNTDKKKWRTIELVVSSAKTPNSQKTELKLLILRKKPEYQKNRKLC